MAGETMPSGVENPDPSQVFLERVAGYFGVTRDNLQGVEEGLLRPKSYQDAYVGRCELGETEVSLREGMTWEEIREADVINLLEKGRVEGLIAGSDATGFDIEEKRGSEWFYDFLEAARSLEGNLALLGEAEKAEYERLKPLIEEFASAEDPIVDNEALGAFFKKHGAKAYGKRGMFNFLLKWRRNLETWQQAIPEKYWDEVMSRDEIEATGLLSAEGALQILSKRNFNGIIQFEVGDKEHDEKARFVAWKLTEGEVVELDVEEEEAGPQEEGDDLSEDEREEILP